MFFFGGKRLKESLDLPAHMKDRYTEVAKVKKRKPSLLN